MVGAGKQKRRVLSASGDRQRAQTYRGLASQNLAPTISQELMHSATKHDAIADELERLLREAGECWAARGASPK